MHVVPRGGGHCFAGRSSTAGLVLDLSPLNAISVSADGLATIGAGARLAQVYDVLHRHRLTIPAGCGPTVGIAGLALGGGLGLLGRRYGLTCDRLVAATVVLADGSVVTCDEQRDAGSVLGAARDRVVVSSVWSRHSSSPPYRRRPPPRFVLTWPREHAAAVIAAWQDWAPDAADDITASLAVTPAEVRMFGAALAPTCSTTSPVRCPTSTSATASRWPELKRSFSEGDSTTIASHHQVRVLPPAAAVDTVAELLTDGCELNFTPMGGAYNRVPPTRPRSSTVASASCSTTRAPIPSAGTPFLVRAHPHASGRVYPNFPDPELTDWAEAYHGPQPRTPRRDQAPLRP